MQCPIISVVLPTYNRPILLSRAICSVLSQSFQHFELIVVDDNSVDDTAEVIKKFGDERIRYIRHDQNRGSSAARNTGIRGAKGEFISFLDDDDEYLPQALDEGYHTLQNLPASVGYVVGGIIVVSDTPGGGVVVAERYPQVPNFASQEQEYLYFLHRTRFGTGCGTMFRRVCFDKAGLFDEELSSAVLAYSRQIDNR